MAKLYDMAQMTVTGGGGSNLTLGSAVAADGITYLTFAGAGAVNGDLVSYRIKDTGGAWEVGRATYSSTGPALNSRTLLFSSTGSLLTVTTAATVMIAGLAEDFRDVASNAGYGAPSVSWLAGTNPAKAVLIAANRALVINSVTCVVMASGASGLTATVKNGAGTAIHSTAFDLSHVPWVTNQTAAVTTLASGDYLWIDTAGTWTSSTSIANITVFLA
jgi:hypothetical protein